MPGASVASATDAEIARNSGAGAPELFASILMGRRPRSVTTEDRTVDGIGVRIYSPSRRGARLPLIVYFHGGGFVFGDLRGGDWICGTVAHRLGAIVVSVDYRLAPRHPFPAGVDDCFTGLKWAAAHADELGADARRIGVMGESAGGNLAAVVALMARDEAGPAVRHQALLYPVTGAYDSESRRTNADAFILTAADMRKFDEIYAGDRNDWRVSPLLAESFAGLPPALIEVAAHDPLHDDGVQYADALRAAGVPVQLISYPSMPHGFLNFPRFARDATPALAAVVKAQRRALR
ncbi:alpha/beta hydrolase [Subtercola sp. YIM 133946]|uniref:alpha/beta hydrolase n=1 Tax=Subtercola sp. YIM 133946 TaxID=3118909 RepID=UPI002F9243DC